MFSNKFNEENIGLAFGFIFSYIVFTAIIFFVFSFRKIIDINDIPILILITLAIIGIGTFLKRLLR